ncbi:GNAT family N-acetyltransferase, partial [Streptococcus pyogenes]
LFVDATQQEAEVGFTLSRGAQGAGHATRAVRAAVALLFESTPVAQVRAVTAARNTPSIRVLERAGFAKSHEQRAVFK